LQAHDAPREMFLFDARFLPNSFSRQEKLIVIIILFVDALSVLIRLAPQPIANRS